MPNTHGWREYIGLERGNRCKRNLINQKNKLIHCTAFINSFSFFICGDYRSPPASAFSGVLDSCLIDRCDCDRNQWTFCLTRRLFTAGDLIKSLVVARSGRILQETSDAIIRGRPKDVLCCVGHDGTSDMSQPLRALSFTPRFLHAREASSAKVKEVGKNSK